jgi:hypothetical protein
MGHAKPPLVRLKLDFPYYIFLRSRRKAGETGDWRYIISINTMFKGKSEEVLALLHSGSTWFLTGP